MCQVNISLCIKGYSVTLQLRPRISFQHRDVPFPVYVDRRATGFLRNVPERSVITRVK
jgi:hypothetical protein